MPSHSHSIPNETCYTVHTKIAVIVVGRTMDRTGMNVTVSTNPFSRKYFRHFRHFGRSRQLHQRLRVCVYLCEGSAKTAKQQRTMTRKSFIFILSHYDNLIMVFTNIMLWIRIVYVLCLCSSILASFCHTHTHTTIG